MSSKPIPLKNVPYSISHQPSFGNTSLLSCVLCYYPSSLRDMEMLRDVFHVTNHGFDQVVIGQYQVEIGQYQGRTGFTKT